MQAEEIEFVSKPILDKVIQSHINKDYALFASCFATDGDISLPSEDEFNQAVSEAIEPLGSLCQVAFLGCLDKRDSKLVLWKSVFDNDEVLWHIYLNPKSKQLIAVWFG